MANAKYFCGEIELQGVYPEKTARFVAIGGIPNKHNRNDSFTRMVGRPIAGPAATLPVDRLIFYKARPSLHKCDARCLHAKGHNCECACGGANHGKGG